MAQAEGTFLDLHPLRWKKRSSPRRVCAELFSCTPALWWGRSLSSPGSAGLHRQSLPRSGAGGPPAAGSEPEPEPGGPMSQSGADPCVRRACLVLLLGWMRVRVCGCTACTRVCVSVDSPKGTWGDADVPRRRRGATPSSPREHRVAVWGTHRLWTPALKIPGGAGPASAHTAFADGSAGITCHRLGWKAELDSPQVGEEGGRGQPESLHPHAALSVLLQSVLRPGHGGSLPCYGGGGGSPVKSPPCTSGFSAPGRGGIAAGAVEASATLQHGLPGPARRPQAEGRFGAEGQEAGALTVGGELVGRVEPRVSAGGRAHVEVEQDVVPQPVAALLQPHEDGALAVLPPLAGQRQGPGQPAARRGSFPRPSALRGQPRAWRRAHVQADGLQRRPTRCPPSRPSQALQPCKPGPPQPGPRAWACPLADLGSLRAPGPRGHCGQPASGSGERAEGRAWQDAARGQRGDSLLHRPCPRQRPGSRRAQNSLAAAPPGPVSPATGGAFLLVLLFLHVLPHW